MKKKEPFNLILLGDPASGKATQAARIAKKYGLYDFDMGKEVRKPAVRARYDYEGTTAKGGLTPTNVARAILRRTIKGVSPGRGILFDGHPKMIGEAKLVARLLRENGRRDPFVIYLYVPTSEALRRRRVRARDDDRPEAVKRRTRYYRSQVARVVAFFRKRYSFKRISGAGTRDEVWKRIRKTIHKHAS